MAAAAAGGGGDAASSSSSSRSSSSVQVHHHHQQQQQHEAALGGRYELQSLRGRGSFAKVWEARHRRTGLKVAVKIISHAKMREQGLSASSPEKEIRVMRMLRHPHVIRFYEAVAAPRHTYIVMELADAGQLWDHVVLQGSLPEAQARAIFRQLAAAVLFCHRSMVAHRDLKMENVLLAGTEELAVKVVDFGFSKVYTDGKPMRKKLGSREYAAPELLATAGGSSYVGPQVDVWSCGVILYGMLCGRLPFDGADVSELARNVRRGDYRVPPWVSDDARDLIAGMLIVRPTKRATMADVMAHRWLHPDTMPPYLLGLAMPVVPPPPVVVDEAAVEQLVTRHGFDRSRLLESLLLGDGGGGGDKDDDAAVAYQLVLATMSATPTRSPQRCWALLHGYGHGHGHGGVLLHDCPRLTMQRIAAALHDLRIPILAYHTRRHRIKCRADVPVTAPASASAPASAAGHNHMVLFEIQVYKITPTATGALQQGAPNANSHPLYVVHLNRTSGPQLPYLSICSQLASRLRRPHN